MTRSGLLKIFLAIAILLGIVGAAVLKLMLEEPPEYAGVKQIQARYGEQLALLAGFAVSDPVTGCDDTDPGDDPMAVLQRMNPLLERVEEIRGHFEMPEILGAEVVFYCGESMRSFVVKSFDRFSWSKPASFAPQEWPAVSLWHSRSGPFVRYEDKLPDAGAGSIRLTVDLALLRGRTGPTGPDAVSTR